MDVEIASDIWVLSCCYIWCFNKFVYWSWADLIIIWFNGGDDFIFRNKKEDAIFRITFSLISFRLDHVMNR